MIAEEKKQYLVVGTINTIFGYLTGVGSYKLLGNIVDIIWVGLISNIFSITFSFLTYKLFVFKTKGSWVNEYIKSYIVYGASGIISIYLLWVFVEKLHITIWVSQALLIAVVVIFSYFGHKFFTFKRKNL
jgi:putative flippase GtrA